MYRVRARELASGSRRRDARLARGPEPSHRRRPRPGVLLDASPSRFASSSAGKPRAPGSAGVRTRADREHARGPVPPPDDDVPRLRRAMHEVPGSQRPSSPSTTRTASPRRRGSVLVCLPVVHGHRFARAEHEGLTPSSSACPQPFRSRRGRRRPRRGRRRDATQRRAVADEPTLARGTSPCSVSSSFASGTMSHGVEPRR